MLRVAVEPEEAPAWVRDAVRRAGVEITEPSRADAVIWGGIERPQRLGQLLETHPGLRWVHFLWSGIDRYIPMVPPDRLCTCGKGSNAEPVAEMAITLALAGQRRLHDWLRTTQWLPPAGTQLYDRPVTLIGGGNIARALMAHLAPFRCPVTVVRRVNEPVEGAARVLSSDRLRDALPGAAVVFLVLSLTPATRGLIGAAELACMDADAWLVNVARGAHVVTDDLVTALEERRIGGAALDVTDPEPLPGDHPLWSLPNCIITPHTANYPEISWRSVAARVHDNVTRYAAGQPLLGTVDLAAGY